MVTPDLLAVVRNYLDITWEDAATDTKLEGIISRGIDYINRRSGAVMDYSVEGVARALLLDYCMYVRARAFADYETHYASELTALRLRTIAGGEATDDADVQ